MPARLEDIEWNLKPGGITYLTRDQWNLVMEKAMTRIPVDGRLYCVQCGVPYGANHLPSCVANGVFDDPKARDPLLVEREKTHGSFTKTAEIAQQLKKIVHIHSSPEIKIAQVEALSMICTKIARILSGNPNEKEHYLDIAGYAKLGAEACDER